ncbi:MAG: M20/M25/M40 family metallo-hydrolase [Bacteroidota bacterium]
MRFRTLLCLTVFLIPNSLNSQSASKQLGLQTITQQAIQAQLEFLASDWTMGRETGTEGEFLASDYIVSVLKSLGLKPGGDRRVTIRTGSPSSSGIESRSWYQNINFIETRPGLRQECSLIIKEGSGVQNIDFQYLIDYSVNPGSYSIDIEAPVIFVGYGIDNPKLRHNDFKNVNVKGKIVLRLSGFPGWTDPESSKYKKFTADPTFLSTYDAAKNRFVLEKGALAVIEIRNGSGGLEPAASNIPFRYNTSTYEGDRPFNQSGRIRMLLPRTGTLPVPRINLSERALNYLLTQMVVDPIKYENEAKEEKLVPSKQQETVFLHLVSSVDSRIVRGRNIIGILEGKDPSSQIVLGAHFDHVGQNQGFIYNGSDDDASGSVGIMTIARAMVATGTKPRNTIIFCLWTAEEKGLLGSEYFVSKADKDKIRCYLNLDMISRTELTDSTGRKCDYNYTSDLPLLRELAETHIRENNLALDVTWQTSAQPMGGSDFSSFSAENIPIFLIHGKFTPDYHQYTDHADKANLAYMTDIVKLGYLNIFELANIKW